MENNMSNFIDVAFVQQYSDNIIQLAQQEGSRLRGTVMNKTVQAKLANFERLGATVAQKKVSRHGDTPLIDVPHSRRRVYMEDYEWAAMIDKEDEVRLLIDPKSSYAKAGAMALGRAMDDIIIAAATGNSISADAEETNSNVALPASQIISEDTGTTDSNLNIEKLILARQKLMAAEIDMSEELTLVANASALMAGLMNETEIQSADFNTVKALVRGDIDTFMGFTFNRTERILGTADGSDTDPVLCLAYAKSAIGLAIGTDINSRISERADKSYLTQVYSCMIAGATRIEEEKVISIKCVQPA
jgi:hypothetical protein